MLRIVHPWVWGECSLLRIVHLWVWEMGILLRIVYPGDGRGVYTGAHTTHPGYVRRDTTMRNRPLPKGYPKELPDRYPIVHPVIHGRAE